VMAESVPEVTVASYRCHLQVCQGMCLLGGSALTFWNIHFVHGVLGLPYAGVIYEENNINNN